MIPGGEGRRLGEPDRIAARLNHGLALEVTI
jgi:hypothetical protein